MLAYYKTNHDFYYIFKPVCETLDSLFGGGGGILSPGAKNLTNFKSALRENA